MLPLQDPADASRWQRRKADRPQEILAAALQLFVEKGFAATKMEDIARAAGVTKGTPYLYFANKEDIFAAVIRDALLPQLALSRELVDNHQGSIGELLRALVLDWWRRMVEHGLSGIPKLIVSEANNFPEVTRFYYEAVMVRGNDLLAAVIDRGIASGEFRAMDSQVAAKVVTAPLFRAMIWRHSLDICSASPTDVEDYLAASLDLLLRGLQQTPPQP